LALFDYSAHPLLPGLLMGLGAGIGDAVKSFFKRRIDIEPGESWPVFDQLDFFLGAYVLVSLVYPPPVLLTLASLPVVLLGNIVSNPVGTGWALRRHGFSTQNVSFALAVNCFLSCPASYSSSLASCCSESRIRVDSLPDKLTVQR
jgi:hypothetical protein